MPPKWGAHGHPNLQALGKEHLASHLVLGRRSPLMLPVCRLCDLGPGPVHCDGGRHLGNTPWPRGHCPAPQAAAEP